MVADGRTGTPASATATARALAVPRQHRPGGLERLPGGAGEQPRAIRGCPSPGRAGPPRAPGSALVGEGEPVAARRLERGAVAVEGAVARVDGDLRLLQLLDDELLLLIGELLQREVGLDEVEGRPVGSERFGIAERAEESDSALPTLSATPLMMGAAIREPIGARSVERGLRLEGLVDLACRPLRLAR